MLLTLAGCSRTSCGRSHTAAGSDAQPTASAAAPNGRWSALPPHGGTGRVRHVAVAIGSAGVFLGVTAEDGPRVVFGRFKGGDVEWSAPWPLPVPPPKPHVKHRTSWQAYGESLAGVHLAIDRLDPTRIAVNLLEDQGGSYGVVVRRWNDTPVHVAYPHSESDIRFGDPLVLRGRELFTHDTTAFWHFRLTDSRVDADDLQLDADELGFHAGIDDAGKTIVLTAFGSLITLRRNSAGKFELHRKVDVQHPIAGLFVFPAVEATVVLEQKGSFDAVTYDSDGKELRRRAVTFAEIDDGSQPSAKYATMHGSRALFETPRGFVVFDIAAGRRARVGPPPSVGSELAAAMDAANVAFASPGGIGIYRLPGVP